MQKTPDFDAVVIGAGLTGMYQLYKLKKLGLTVKGIEASSDVGGVWNWNRYPGCRVDSEAYTYAYAWSEKLRQEFNWTERFASQPEVLRYLNSAADTMDVRGDYVFNARVKKATYDESGNFWRIELEEGGSAPLTARYLISAVGPLSAPQMPKVDGVHTFEGEAYHTGRWPRDHEGFGGANTDFSGKRVAVIGTGSSGVQVIQEVAKSAKSLHVFQRSPNWCLPLRNAKITPQEMDDIRKNYDDIFRQCETTPTSFIHNWIDQDLGAVSDSEREATFERLYQQSGFSFWLCNYRDIMVNAEANRVVGEFVARKIRQRVKNPATADKLIPTDHPFGGKRIPLETGYFEVFNQDNVTLIDLKETPIARVTRTGLETTRETYAFDVIIYATGFDAILGSLQRIDVVGKGGTSLKDAWKEGVKTNLGLQVHGFPNFFIHVGPQSGTVFCNMPRCSSYTIEWLTDLLKDARDRGLNTIESSVEAQEKWSELCGQILGMTLIGSTNSWFTGINRNIEGRDKRGALIFAGGSPLFRETCQDVKNNGYSGIHLS